MDCHNLQNLPPAAFLRLPDVIALTGIKSSTIYDLVQHGRFPAPHKITARASGWRAAEIFSWLESPRDWRVESNISASA
jgi:prophage regulatory protein